MTAAEKFHFDVFLEEYFMYTFQLHIFKEDAKPSKKERSSFSG